jgi:hypothetical protein
MTADRGAVPNVRTSATGLDLERLQVAARSVLDWIAEAPPGGLVGAHLDQVTHHAQALVDLHGAAASPFCAARAHALRVRNELIELATERSLTIAVWIDDALGLAHRSGAVTTDPAEDMAGVGTAGAAADEHHTVP